MLAALIAAIVLASVFAAAAIWLSVGRGTLQARTAGAEAELRTLRERSEAEGAHLRAEAEQARARSAEEIARLQQRLEEGGVRAASLQAEVARLSEQLSASAEMHRQELGKHQELFAERTAALERQKHVLETEFRSRMEELNQKFRIEFDALAGTALKNANEEFLKRAESLMKTERDRAAAEIELKKAAVDLLIKPIGETLQKTGAKLEEIDKSRTETEARLVENLRAVSEGNAKLTEETSRLVQALRQPHVRGRYGQMQLRRVAELAGMQAYCDFAEEDHTIDADGNALRPDMIVRMPNERVVVVDAKTNIQAYLDALQARDPAEAEACLDRFAGHVARQATALAKKQYWTAYEGSPEFVVMFIPGDQFIDAALARQPELLETAASQRVLLAGPATLIGLLRAVAVGYQEQRLARDAAELRQLGAELYDRARIAFEHATAVGGFLEKAVRKYNDFIGSYQSRLEPTLRRFQESGVGSGRELPGGEGISLTPRMVSLPEPLPQPHQPG
jgi:DNA recombination protein RmuC